MYKPALILFSFFSLASPILAVPVPVPNEIHGLVQRDATSFTGQGDVYEPGLGACGTTNTSDQLVVAIPVSLFGNGDHCGKQVNIQFNGNSVQAMVVDKCETCGTQGIDMSPAAFQKLTGMTTPGQVSVVWNFV